MHRLNQMHSMPHGNIGSRYVPSLNNRSPDNQKNKAKLDPFTIRLKILPGLSELVLQKSNKVSFICSHWTVGEFRRSSENQ